MIIIHQVTAFTCRDVKYECENLFVIVTLKITIVVDNNTDNSILSNNYYDKTKL